MDNTCGLFLIDKPAGISSFDVIRVLRRTTQIKKMGHTGTLDPFATGLMLILTGKATRLIKYIANETKGYHVKMRFGQQTDTGDPEGEIDSESPPPDLTDSDLVLLKENVLKITEQTPPKYSAVKINGQRAYKLARKKQEVVLTSRPVQILEFHLHEYMNDELEYDVLVSKGTYIRVLSETIGTLCGSAGYTLALSRTSAGNTKLADAFPLESVTVDNWTEHLCDPALLLEHLPIVEISEMEKIDFSQGKKAPIEDDITGKCRVYSNGIFCGIARVEDGLLKPETVLI
ncbi:MAG: tRNA pseudouridine(55) synthase TruB [Candidatus Cloacimonetes bacterium]|nr:tRNA pseudouridine(55) synthase TruB [Candidatus Cloacimonadota bacterium]